MGSTWSLSQEEILGSCEHLVSWTKPQLPGAGPISSISVFVLVYPPGSVTQFARPRTKQRRGVLHS